MVTREYGKEEGLKPKIESLEPENDSIKNELEKLKKKMGDMKQKIEDLLKDPDKYTEYKLPFRREITLNWFLEFLTELINILIEINKLLEKMGRMPEPTALKIKKK